MIGSAGRWQSGDCLGTQGFRRSCDRVSFPLLETLIHPQCLVGVRSGRMPCLDPDEPNALQKIGEQKRRSDKLRTAKGFGLKKSAQLLETNQTECFTMSGTMMDNKPFHADSPGLGTQPTNEESQLVPGVQSAEMETSLATSNAGRKSSLHRIFVGPDGIYVLLRWAAYLAMALLIFLVEGLFLSALRPHLSAILGRLMIEASLAVAAILPGFAMSRIEKHPFGDFGLPARHAFGRNFWIGALWGIGSLSVLMLFLHFIGAFEFGSLAIHGLRIWKFAAYYAAFFLFTGFFEEFLIRGYSLWVLSRGINFWPTAVLLSVSFGALHSGNAGESPVGVVAAGLIGFFLCLTLRRTGNLWFAVGFHMAWDWGESYLYSVPDSGTLFPGHLLKSSFHGPRWLTGGMVGPEGSVLCFVVIAAVWVGFARAYPEVRYRVQEPLTQWIQRVTG